MTDFKIIFVHGYTASHLGDWYPAISPKLDALDIDYVIPDMPGGELPHANEWVDMIHKEVSKTKKPIVLVGHSLGTRAILLYLEKYNSNVDSVFLIAAFANRTENAKRNEGEAYPDFFEHKIDIGKIKPLVGEWTVIHSKDDSSIPYEQGVEIAKDLGAKLITYDGRDHFSDSSNAPIVFKELQRALHF